MTNPNVDPTIEGLTPLRGRDAARHTIDRCLREARAGHGSVVLVEGRRGFGKSRLLHEARAAANAAGFRVGAGTAVHGDVALSMSVLQSALSDGATPIVDRSYLAAAASRIDPDGVVEGLLAPLEQAARSAPVLVCIDDAQWVDGGTAAALRLLARRLEHLPIVWVVAFHTRSSSPLLMDLVAHLDGVGAELVALDALDDGAIAQVVSDVLQAQPTPALLQFAGCSEGSPVLLVELMRGLVEEGLVRVVSGRAELAEARVPRRLCNIVRAELARVSPIARQISAVASILGTTVSFDHVASMLDLAPAALLGPIEELVNAELLVYAGCELAFPNDLLRFAVIETIPPTARHSLQRQAIGVLLEAGASPIEPALNLASSAQPGDRVAISALLDAAHALGPVDAVAAADLGRCAFDLTAPGDDLRAPLVADVVPLLAAAGRTEAAAQLADAVLREALAPEHEAAIRLSLARMPALAPDVRAEAGRAALARPGLPLEWRARHLSEQIANVLAAGDLAGAQAMVARAEAAVADSGDRDAAATLEIAKVEIAGARGEFEEALQRLDASGMRPGAGVASAQRVELLHAELLLAVDDFDAAHQLAADGLATARRGRHAAAERAWRRFLGRCLTQAGRISEAAVTLDGALDDGSAAALAVPTVDDASTLAALGRAAIHLGDGRRARTLAKLAGAVRPNGCAEVHRHASWLLALLHMAGGDPVSARAQLAPSVSDTDHAVLPYLMGDITDSVQLVRIARDSGDDELARRVVAFAEAQSHRNPGLVSLAGTAAHTRGLLEGDIAMLADAVAHFAGGPRRLAHASALEDYGCELVRCGDRTSAVDALGRALQLYSSGGAVWDASRVRRRLRDLGVRRRLVKVSRPTSGWSSLTDSEVAVVRLVADGLTNREVAERLFVSPHTVSMHLRHVFTKLEITSRVELTRLAFQQDEAA